MIGEERQSVGDKVDAGRLVAVAGGCGVWWWLGESDRKIENERGECYLSVLVGWQEWKEAFKEALMR